MQTDLILIKKKSYRVRKIATENYMSFERLLLKFLLVVQSNYANKLAVVKCIKYVSVLYRLSTV